METNEMLDLENKLLDPTAEEPICLPLYFLKYITDDFSEELGRGGYGVVYKGLLPSGDSSIAVKKIEDRNLLHDDDQFQKEATFLRGIQHPNVIRLLGYCSESKGQITELNGTYVFAEIRARMLCFEYLCNKSLDKHLSDESSGLEWNTRYNIIKGICNGLNYLHGRHIMHLDLKPQNILMDSSMMPKIADFGLSRLLGEQKSHTVIKTSNRPGTRGYMAPEYIDRGIISEGADIFSLGVIIIEILKGCKDDYPDYDKNMEIDSQQFTEKVLSNWRNRFERSPEYTSPELQTQLVKKCKLVKKCIDIAIDCVHPEKEKRPNVSNIIEILNAAEGSCVQEGEDLLVDHQPVKICRNDDLVPLLLRERAPRPDVVTRSIGSKEEYTKFIMELRRKLPPVAVDDILGESPGAYPVLRRQSPRASRWLWVELQAVVDQQAFTTTLAVRDDNVYCKGFRNQRGVWYELSGERPIQNCPMLPSSGEWGNVQQLPGWDVSYTSILLVDNEEQVEDILRSSGLGKAFAETAVRRLARYPAVDGRDDYLTRLALAGLIVMVCESARFNVVLDTLVGGWDSGTGLTPRLAGYMWEWKDMSHGLLQWRTDGHWPRAHRTARQHVRSAGHALAHIHLVLNYNKNPKNALGCYNLHGKNSRSNNPEQDKGGPGSEPSRGPWGSRQHGTNSKSVLSKQASESTKDDNAPDDPSEPGEDDRQRQNHPEETLPRDDNPPDPGHPGEDDDAHQGPDQPGEDDSSQQGLDKISERYGRPRVEIFAVRANFHVRDMTISVFDGIRGQTIYMPNQEEQQPEAMEVDGEMNDLVLTGPYRGISAYGNFVVQVDMPSSATTLQSHLGGKEEASTSSSGDTGGPITWEWDRYNPEHAAQVDAPEPVTHAISLDLWRKINVTYLVMSNAVEATVKVKLPEKPQDYLPHEEDREADHNGGRKYTARGTITAHIGGFEKHPIVLFTSALGVPIPSESLTLPLARPLVQVPQGKLLHIDMADLHIAECSSNREVKRPADSDSLSFDFGHVSPSLQFNNDTEAVEVNVKWLPQQNKGKIQVKPHQVCIIGDKEKFSAFIGNLRRMLADHPDREDALEDYRGKELASIGKHPVLTRPRVKQPKGWIHIELQLVAGQETSSTTLAVRDDKCYGVGFVSQSGVWYDLGNRRGDRALPPEYNSVLLNWGVSYKDILHVSSWDEVMEELDSARPSKDFAKKAVRTLSRYPYVQEGDNTRLAVAGLLIMVCESAKFNPLLKHFVDGWDNGTGFPRQLMNYIRNWGHVSRALLRWKDLGYDYDTWRHCLGQQPVGISDPEYALDVVHLVFNSREAPSNQVGISDPEYARDVVGHLVFNSKKVPSNEETDSRPTECEIMELENKHPTAAEPVSLPLGFLISITDDFSEEQEIGSGGYGVVYKGILPCGSVIAIKKFDERTLAGDDGSFEDEASSLMHIEHQNIVQLLGFCSESRGPMMMKQPNGKCNVVEQLTRMLCFEYMCNRGLDKHLSDESSGLEWYPRFKIIKGICSGLKYLHECNITHLDLKPQNILMDTTMMPKITDFGLSRLLSEQKSKTVTSNRHGTRGYMAPEYIDRGVISKKADIFSLGVIIIEILKGCKDYPDYGQSTEVFQHFTEKVLSNWRTRFERSSKYTTSELRTQLVKQCMDIALECVHPDKEKRPNVSNIIEILNAAEESCYGKNGKDLPVDHPMGTQEGLPPSGVLREVDLIKIALKDHAQAWIAKDKMKSAVAPHQPQHEPALDGYQVARSASVGVAHNALVSLDNNLLKDWAATNNIAPNVNSLELELISVKAILESTLGRVIHNSGLNHSLMMLQDLIYEAEDVVDEMEYFRIQDMLDARQHAGALNLNLNLLPSVSDEPPPGMIFDSVDASNRMKHIVEKMQEVQRKISGIRTHLGSNWSTFPNIAQSRPISTSESTELKLYGRELMMKRIIDDITKDKHSSEVLTVIPIVGPGGIGKTTLAQHIYHSREVREHFNVRVWTCVSLKFNVNKLIEDIQRYIPKVDGELTNDTASELIGKRLKNKRLLLVLDDIWDCSDEDEWKWLLVPFKKSQVQGNIIIVTTRFPAQAKIMVQKNDHSIYLQGIKNSEFEKFFEEIIFGDDDQSRKEHRFLLETGFKIAGRLKGSPLAAKTVGRLLKTHLDLVHWTRILESKEWEHSDGKNDIMPALKLSFDYLPSQLQRCFSYCALFPQDYEYEREELINFWIGQKVLHYSSHGGTKRVEDIGLCHLIELVNYGFLENKGEKDGRTCYIIHDLLHELAQKVSSLECLSIDTQSQLSSLQIPTSIRHLSINIYDTSVNDRLTQRKCVEDFSTLHTRLKVEKLQTLMIFGNHHGCFVKVFRDLFREAKALRVIFLSKASYDLEYLLCNFYSLIHLRYLRIDSSPLYKARFSNKISRFYHMMVLDAKHCDIIDLPSDVSNLVKLRHLLVQDDKIHSSITKVGKLKSLQELRRFVAGQDDQGFELRQIGHLEELCGSLCIDSLENVQVLEEADEGKLMLKGRLHELILSWNINRSMNDSFALEEHVLERLKPNSNLQELSIIGHRGGTCPSWLGMNLSLNGLKSLCLNDVAWKTFPPIGDLWLVNVPREKISINIPEKRFGNLRRLELVHLSGLKAWAVHAPCELFPYLEVLIIKDCPQLVELSLQHFGCCQEGKELNINFFPRLKKLDITNCPQLLFFPPVPWNEAPCSINIEGIGSSYLGKLVCDEEGNSCEYRLTIEGKEDIYTTDSTFWNILAFHNLTGLTVLKLRRCQPLPLCYLQMLSSLRTLEISCVSNFFPFVEADSHIKYQFSVELLRIENWNASGKELTRLLTYFPKLSVLYLWGCNKVTRLGTNVRGQRTTQTPGPSSSSVDIVSSEEAEHSLLLLPPQLQKLEIWCCRELSLLGSNPHDDSNLPRAEDGPTGGGGGLRGLTSLRQLVLADCPVILSSYSSSSFSSSFPFPNSLEHLEIYGEVGMDTLVPLSNLTSLTSLVIFKSLEFLDSTGEGLLSLLTQGHLNRLEVTETPNLFLKSDPLQVHEQELPSYSSELQELKIDYVAGFATTYIHRRLLFSSLNKLEISHDYNVERFTEEQEALLFVNSLVDISFSFCCNLQSLPECLRRLPNLKRLHIWYCDAIQMLPKDGLPSSLEDLVIIGCPEIRSLPKDCLPDSLQKLIISECPAIRSLPNLDDLPNSLRELDVRDSESEELRNQCRRLINIIPIVKV